MTIRKDILLRRQTEFKDCECGCKEKIPIFNYEGFPAHYKHGHNSKGKNNPVWKGGKRFDGRYYRKWVGVKKWKYEHRDIWERENNACLLWWADVDHINEDKLDNRPENLRAMMREAHDKIHNNLLKPKHKHRHD